MPSQWPRKLLQSLAKFLNQQESHCKSLVQIFSPKKEQIEEKVDSWGKCLNRILYYEKVEGVVKTNLSEMNDFLEILNKRKAK